MVTALTNLTICLGSSPFMEMSMREASPGNQTRIFFCSQPILSHSALTIGNSITGRPVSSSLTSKAFMIDHRVFTSWACVAR